MEVIDMELVDTNISIIKEAFCLSLSGSLNLTYQIGRTPDDIVIRLLKSSGTGKFNPQCISLTTLDEMIRQAESPFTLSILSPLFKHQSTNNIWFIGALLKDLGLVTPKDKGYVRTKMDIKALGKKPRTRKDAA